MTCNEVVTWLNMFDTSHLSKVAEEALARIKDPRITETDRDAAIETALKAAEKSKDPLEYAEFLVLCAEDRISRGRLSEGSDFLSQAIKIYRGVAHSQHRLATAWWMLGCVQWRLRENYTAYDNWRQASEVFLGFSKSGARGRVATTTEWYRERLEEMKTEMACRAEHALTWLNYFEASRLKQEVVAFRDGMINKLKRGDYRAVREDIQTFAAWAEGVKDVIERAEMYVECGLAAHQSGSDHEAVSYFNKAITLYFPLSHKRAVTRWMLGAVEWQIAPEKRGPFRSWRKSIDEFEKLAADADREVRKTRLNWYRKTLEIMNSALMRRSRGA